MTGLIVEGRCFGLKEAQARAYARNLAEEYGRPVKVLFRAPGSTGSPTWVATFKPEEDNEAA